MKTTHQLYFDYQSTAKIRIKIDNVYKADEWPGIYAVVTKKLSFLIPKVAVILTKTHAYIPLSFYRDVLNNFYKQLNKPLN